MAAVAFPTNPGDDEDKPRPAEKYNVKQYRGLADNVVKIKDQVEKERKVASETHDRLRVELKDQDAEAKQIQKEMTVQLNVSNRSYEKLLGAMREITDELRKEVVERRAECDPLYEEIKILKKKLSIIEKPWKEEVAKRDLKILKLQELIPPLEQKIREEKMKLPPVIEKFKEEIKLREDATESVLKEIAFIQVEQKEKDAAAATELAEHKAWAHAQIKPLKEELEETKAILAVATDPYKKEIKELNRTIARLDKELAAVDYSPYEKSLDIKDQAYSKLVRDFEVKTVYNKESIEKMRDNYEAVITKMDKKMVAIERGKDEMLVPFREKIALREKQMETMKVRMEDLKIEEEERREREQAIIKEIKEELAAAKEAVDLSFGELTKAKKQLQAHLEDMEGGAGPFKRMKMLELKLENVTLKCQALIVQRDRELAEKTDIIYNLQVRMRFEADKLGELDKAWDGRIQKKEEGYKKVTGELAFAEGQIVEERERTAARLREVRARELDIVRLKEEHTEELLLRLHDREQLELSIKEREKARLGTTVQYEEHIKVLNAEVQFWRQRREADLSDLAVEVQRRDRARVIVEAELKQVRAEYDKARITWEDKERELDVFIRNRDRHITALKNEIEFINDSWEIKYNNLLAIFEKLQKKYDEVVGPNGPQEAQRRVRDLKEEIVLLNTQIEDLKEQLKKQKRRIRDLELDIDGVMKETCDILAEKERGIAEMVGDYAKLQNKFRELGELMERLLKEADAEKIEIVNSFQLRIDQLEQLVESMRFTDRQELVDKIETWKKAYERVCIQRDDIEDELTELVDIKEVQVQKMAEENNDVRDKQFAERVNWMQEVEDVETRWKKKEIRWGMDKVQQEKRYADLEELLRLAKKEIAKLSVTHDDVGADEEKDELRRIIEEKDQNIAAIEAGIPGIVEENRLLASRVDNVGEDIGAIHDSYKPIIEEKDKIIAKMAREHEDLKQVLEVEMYKAQEACMAIVEQVKRFPNPFEIEVKEMRDKYAQMQAGMIKMNLENIKLREDFIDIRDKKDQEIKELEAQLEVATRILGDVSGIGALQGMSREEAAKMEAEMGIDLDGDGQVGSAKNIAT